MSNRGHKSKLNAKMKRLIKRYEQPRQMEKKTGRSK